MPRHEALMALDIYRRAGQQVTLQDSNVKRILPEENQDITIICA
jgi:hypothetical protein